MSNLIDDLENYLKEDEASIDCPQRLILSADFKPSEYKKVKLILDLLSEVTDGYDCIMAGLRSVKTYPIFTNKAAEMINKEVNENEEA